MAKMPENTVFMRVSDTNSNPVTPRRFLRVVERFFKFQIAFQIAYYVAFFLPNFCRCSSSLSA